MPNTAFRGWWIVAVAFLSQGIAIGLTIIPYGFFATPITEEFGISLGVYQSGLAVFTLVMTGVGPLVGWLLDRRSIRAVMTSGSLVLAGSFFGLSLATELWQLGLGFGVGAAVGVALTGPLPATTVIAKWFERKRGRAVGIATMGIPVGGLVLVPLAGQILAAFGWRETLQAFAAISLLLAPLAFIIVRNRPEDLGQPVDGEEPDSDDRAAPVGVALTTAEIFSRRNFWLLATGVGLVFGFSGGWNANAPRFGEDLGYTAEHMAALIGMAAGLGAPATVLFGALADRYDNRALLIVGIAAQASCLAVLWASPEEVAFTAAVLLFGLAGGGLMPVYAAFIGRLFGAASFGSVMGLGGLVMLPFGSAAPIVAGAMRDASGSYQDALLAFLVAFVVACVLLALVRPAERSCPAAGSPE